MSLQTYTKLDALKEPIAATILPRVPEYKNATNTSHHRRRELKMPCYFISLLYVAKMKMLYCYRHY